MSECACQTAEQAIHCQRSGTRMVKPLWELCKKRVDLRRLWDSLPKVQLPSVFQQAADRTGTARIQTCKHRINGAIKVNGKAKMRES